MAAPLRWPMPEGTGFDVVVAGRGILGLAHAWAAARAGCSVLVIDRQARATGASIRNFGFVTVTGQERRIMWPLARRARDLWAHAAPRAGIPIVQTGLVLPVRRPAGVAVLEAFLRTEMGEGCGLVSAAGLAEIEPEAPFTACEAALVSPHELRIEAREALPRLAAWLEAEHGVRFAEPAEVTGWETGRLHTRRGSVRADLILLCPGDGVLDCAPELARDRAVTRCKLQMLRLAAPGWRLRRPVMSDLGLQRYKGYSELPEAADVTAQLNAEQAAEIAAGVHLIVTQSEDGSLVVGDSHDYGDAPDPFLHESVDRLILGEYAAVLGPPPPATEAWMGVYASSPSQDWFTETLAPGVQLTVVSCGAGMSTAFAIGEQVVRGATGAALGEIR